VQDHYQLTDESYSKLLSEKVTVVDLFKNIELFDPHGTGEPIDKVGLLYYLDKKGDFNTGAKFPHKKIALAIFDRLPIKDKIMVAEYIALMENKWIEIEDYDDEDDD